MSPTTTTTGPIDLRNPGRPIHVGVILLSGTTEILDVAPIDLLHSLTPESLAIFPPGVISDEMRKQAVNFEFHYINETGKPARMTSGMTINVTDTFTSCPPLDICLLGATLDSKPYTPTQAELTFLRETYNSPTLHSFLTICGGMMPPLQAGLLHGKRATAPRPMLPMVKQMAPGTEWTERRWEVDESGKLWTSGTLLNGCDMIREWAGRTWGANPKSDLMGVMLEFGGWPVRNEKYEDDDGRLRGMGVGEGVVRGGRIDLSANRGGHGNVGEVDVRG